MYGQRFRDVANALGELTLRRTRPYEKGLMPSLDSRVASEPPTFSLALIRWTSDTISTVPLLILVGMFRACTTEHRRHQAPWRNLTRWYHYARLPMTSAKLGMQHLPGIMMQLNTVALTGRGLGCLPGRKRSERGPAQCYRQAPPHCWGPQDPHAQAHRPCTSQSHPSAAPHQDSALDVNDMRTQIDHFCSATKWNLRRWNGGELPQPGRPW